MTSEPALRVAPVTVAPALEPLRRAASASLIGREHVRLGRNNQDGVAFARRGDVVAGVVCDGCSSQPSSEVGAQLAARFLANWLAAHGEPSAALAARAIDALCGWMYCVASGLQSDGQSLERVLETYFLCTALGVVHTRERAVVFGVGDGGVIIDDEVLRLDAGPDNAPAYAAYRLLPGARPAPQVHFEGVARRVALLTDGFDGVLATEPDRVRALCDGEAVWRNPFTLQRRLNVLGDALALSDDASLVVVDG